MKDAEDRSSVITHFITIFKTHGISELIVGNDCSRCTVQYIEAELKCIFFLFFLLLFFF